MKKKLELTYKVALLQTQYRHNNELLYHRHF